jgi:hypothetical protein
METEPPKAEPPKRKRRWFQFSLRTLMIFTVICALAIAWVGRWTDQKRKEREAVDALVKLGGHVSFAYQQTGGSGTPPGPAWLRKLVGDNAFSEVEEVSFIGDTEYVHGGGSNVSDEALVNLTALAATKRLELLITPKITDAGLANVRGLSQLDRLAIQGTQLTDVGLQNLLGLPQIEHLLLADNRITDAGLTKLAGLTDLRELSFRESGVTDAALVNLESLERLEDLSLRGGQFTNAGLAHLKGLSRLKSLNLYGNKITDAGLGNFKNLTQLQTLVLDENDITDAGLAHFRGLTQLKTLSLVGTKVTDAGVTGLQAAMPKCRIIH